MPTSKEKTVSMPTRITPERKVRFLPEKRALEIMGGKEDLEQSYNYKTFSGEKLVLHFLDKELGAGYWGEGISKEGEKAFKGVFNHVMLEYNAAIHIAKKLKKIGEEKGIEELAKINVLEAAEASLLSDIAKRRAEEEMRKHPERIDEHGVIGEKMLREAGFSENIAHAAISHDFPTSIKQLPTIYDKLALFTDCISGQRYMTVEERLKDIETRWIPKGLITEEKFAAYKTVVLQIAEEIFDLLDVNVERPEEVKEFIGKIPHSREEKYLRALFQKDIEEKKRQSGQFKKRGMRLAEKMDKTNREG